MVLSYTTAPRNTSTLYSVFTGLLVGKSTSPDPRGARVVQHGAMPLSFLSVSSWYRHSGSVDSRAMVQVQWDNAWEQFHPKTLHIAGVWHTSSSPPSQPLWSAKPTLQLSGWVPQRARHSTGCSTTRWPFSSLNHKIPSCNCQDLSTQANHLSLHK